MALKKRNRRKLNEYFSNIYRNSFMDGKVPFLIYERDLNIHKKENEDYLRDFCEMNDIDFDSMDDDDKYSLLWDLTEDNWLLIEADFDMIVEGIINNVWGDDYDWYWKLKCDSDDYIGEDLIWWFDTEKADDYVEERLSDPELYLPAIEKMLLEEGVTREAAYAFADIIADDLASFGYSNDPGSAEEATEADVSLVDDLYDNGYMKEFLENLLLETEEKIQEDAVKKCNKILRELCKENRALKLASSVFNGPQWID